MKKKTYLRPIIIGFAALYLFGMLIATYLVKEKYSSEYARNYSDTLRTAEYYFNYSTVGDSNGISYMMTNYLEYAGMDSKYQQFSVAVYAPDNQKFSQLCSDMYVPYLSDGIDRYEQWANDDFVQNFPEYYQQYHSTVSARSVSGLEVHDETSTPLTNTNIGSGSYTLVLRSTTKPLLAALDYLKYIYPISLLFVLLCIIIVTYCLNRTYKRRELVAETRRDFTNAIAHELKTPLGIIRNFTENLLENTHPEKESYYLRQIIKQTEFMKEMKQEMLYVSDLDSEELKLKKEPVSLLTVIEEQYEKLAPLADEKNLELRYEEKEDFIVNGDKLYLEKAIWNLLSNAVTYNRLDGFITVHVSSDFCSIENTGKQIADDDLPHVFDMFYTGDKSRNSREKHLGLGLYLAKRILALHHLNLTIENTDIGVKVIIQR